MLYRRVEHIFGGEGANPSSEAALYGSPRAHFTRALLAIVGRTFTLEVLSRRKAACARVATALSRKGIWKFVLNTGAYDGMLRHFDAVCLLAVFFFDVKLNFFLFLLSEKFFCKF